MTTPSAAARDAALDFFETGLSGQLLEDELANVLDAFAARAVAEEREACARLCDGLYEPLEDVTWGCLGAAKDIRARGGQGDTNLQQVKDLVSKQAEDEGLWFEARTAPEAYLQAELRKLHAALEAGTCP